MRWKCGWEEVVGGGCLPVDSDGRRWMKNERGQLMRSSLQTIESMFVSFATEVQLFALYYSMSQLLQV